MIIVQDRIHVWPRNRAELERRFRDDYAPAAARRGLGFVDAWISPPFDLVAQPVELCLRWQVADIQAWWAMRSAAGDPAVAAFWRAIAPLVVSRERRYLVAEALAAGGANGPPRAPEATWAPPVETAAFAIETRGWRETAQLTLHAGATASDVESLRGLLDAASRTLPGLVQVWIAPNFIADHGAGHLTWDLLFPDRANATSARASAPWRETIAPALARHCTRWAALGLETVGAGLARPDLKEGVKRTAYFRVLPHALPAERLRWEKDLLEMPAHVTAIRNWRLARAVELDWSNARVAPWTHVWEQEYETLDGLTVDYMVHPHHWAHVDRWFDPESGSQIIDTALCHAFSPLPAACGTILGRDA